MFRFSAQQLMFGNRVVRISNVIRIHRSTFAKLQTLFNKESRITLAAEKTKELLGKFCYALIEYWINSLFWQVFCLSSLTRQVGMVGLMLSTT